MTDDATAGLLAFSESESESKLPEKAIPNTNCNGLRVAMIGLRGFSDGLGGVETAVRETSVRLAAMGMDITCFCRSRYNSNSEFSGVRLVNIPAPPLVHSETAVYALQAAAKATFGNFDIIHFHALTSSLMAWIPLLFSDKKIVATIHGLDWKRDKWGPISRAILLRGEWCAMRLPHGTVSVSSSTKNDLAKRYGLRHIEHIPNGQSPCQDPPPPPDELKDQRYILSMGRLVPEKGIHRLIKAYRGIDTDARLVIAGGDGHSRKYGRKLKKLASGDGRIIFTGTITGKTKERFLANASLFVLPSTLEGHPISLIEACTWGICPVVSCIPEAVEVLGEHCNGNHIFDPLSISSIAGSIEHFLSNPDEAKTLGEQISGHVMATYDWDRTAAMTRDLYLRLMGYRP